MCQLILHHHLLDLRRVLHRKRDRICYGIPIRGDRLLQLIRLSHAQTFDPMGFFTGYPFIDHLAVRIQHLQVCARQFLLTGDVRLGDLDLRFLILERKGEFLHRLILIGVGRIEQIAHRHTAGIAHRRFCLLHIPKRIEISFIADAILISDAEIFIGQWIRCMFRCQIQRQIDIKYRFSIRIRYCSGDPIVWLQDHFAIAVVHLAVGIQADLRTGQVFLRIRILLRRRNFHLLSLIGDRLHLAVNDDRLLIFIRQFHRFHFIAQHIAIRCTYFSDLIRS